MTTRDATSRWAISRPPDPAPQAPPRHSRLEDVVGTATGAFLASTGLFLLQSGGAVTGGTAGLSLLVTQVTGWPFALLFVLVSLPFMVLAALRKGWGFAARSVAAIGGIAGFSLLHPLALGLERVAPVYATLAGNLLVGIGVLILFRHGASAGGFNVVALLAQERLGWRAGYVQLCLDALVVLASAAVVPWPVVPLSAAGAVVLNLVLAMNHRPGRYLGA